MRTVVVLSVALIGSLVGAYATWTRPEADLTVQTQVPVYEVAPDGLLSVKWTSDMGYVMLEKRTDDRGSYLWVTQTKVPKPVEASPDEEEAPTDTSQTPEPTSVAEFRTSERGDELWGHFSPLMADRRLPINQQLEAYGLDEPTATLTIERQGADTLELQVGGNTFGKKHTYVQGGENIWLVPDAIIRNLKYSVNRINLRKLHPLALPDIQSVSVTYKGETRSWTQRTPGSDDKSQWFEQGKNKPDNAVATWVEKSQALTIVGPMKQSEIASAKASTTPLATIEFTGTDGTVWPIEMSVATSMQLYATSPFTKQLVKLTASAGRSLSADLESIFTEEQ